MCEITVRVLLENYALPESGLETEHGLSLLIEHRGKNRETRLLFDTGASPRFSRNAESLGVTLAKVDAGVLSHAHYDHCGGLETFFSQNSTAPFYLSRQAPESRCWKLSDKGEEFIGIDPELFRRHKERFILFRDRREIMPGIELHHVTARTYPKPKDNQALRSRDDAGGFPPDQFDHEIFMVLKAEGGIHIITGCSHNGIMNIIETARRSYPEQGILSVSGGFHLRTDRESAETAGRLLAETGIPRLYSGHCTSQESFKILKGYLGERLQGIPAGTVYRL